MRRSEGTGLSAADRIRAFLVRQYVRPASAAGHREITIRAGDVHKEIGLSNRMPAVCSVLDGKSFREENGLKLIERSGPPQGSNASFRFRLGSAELVKSVPTKVTEPARLQTELVPEVRMPNGGVTICLISCVSEKRAIPSVAKDLYVSDWFRKARHFAERRGLFWFILSAEYGLVAPDSVIAPYEKTLNTMAIRDWRAWAQRVINQISSTVPNLRKVVILAGQRYREFLTDELKRRNVEIEVPMEGLRIGEQLSWLGRQ